MGETPYRQHDAESHYTQLCIFYRISLTVSRIYGQIYYLTSITTISDLVPVLNLIAHEDIPDVTIKSVLSIFL